jgi:epoxyqueuosine reductase QueG
MTLEQHPDVVWYREQHAPAPESTPGASPAALAPPAEVETSQEGEPVASGSDGELGTVSRPAVAPLPRLRAAELRELCLSAGADDVGFVEIGRAAIADQRDEVLSILPGAATVVSLVFRLNRFGLRSTLHSTVDAEFQQNSKLANRAVRTIAMRLGKLGVRAVHLPVGFPFETSRWPGKMWPIAEKPMAEAAGMGRMGWHRCVIHPEFGGAITLGTVLVAAELDEYGQPLEVAPCFECKQCVSVCPTGAIAADGHFDFVSCYTHNYRERLGGFQDWVERLARSESTADYRAKVSDAETVSMWQNLSVGPQTKCDKCLAVCPAGREVIGEYLTDEKAFRATVSERLRDKPETIYVVPGSDAEASVTKRFPAKKVRRVGNGLRPNSPSNFLGALPLIFQRGQAEGLAATYHFAFTGMEPCEGTVVIEDQTIAVSDGLVGTADLRVTADGAAWVAFLAKEKGLPAMLLSRKLKLKGSPKLMSAFARCFPS